MNASQAQQKVTNNCSSILIFQNINNLTTLQLQTMQSLANLKINIYIFTLYIIKVVMDTFTFNM